MWRTAGPSDSRMMPHRVVMETAGVPMATQLDAVATRKKQKTPQLRETHNARSGFSEVFWWNRGLSGNVVNSHACREKCFLSKELAAAGGATEDPEDAEADGWEATADPEDSPGSPRRCWMEWSWKHGSERRTEAARDVLQRDDRRRNIRSGEHLTAVQRRCSFFK